MTRTRQLKNPISRAQFLSAMGLGVAGGAVIAAPGAQAQPQAESTTGTVFNVRDYGAVGDGVADDSPAFTQAIRDIGDSIASGRGGVLYIPGGDYRIDNRLSFSKQRWYLTILGDGQGVSNLYCTNPDGILQIESTTRESQIAIRDLSLFATQPGPGTADGTGVTALEITQPDRGNNHYRNLIIQNVEMRGVDPAADYFDVCLMALNQWRPLLWNVITAGPYRGDVNQDRTDDSPLYAANCGMDVSGSYAPQFQNCYVWSAHTGIRNVVETTPAPEGTFFYNCFIVAVRDGIDIRMGDIGDDFPLGDNPEPGLAIDRCHVNARDVGIRLTKGYFSVTNCLLYNTLAGNWPPEDAPAYRDIELDKCIGGIISHNIMHQPTNANRIGVDVGRSVDIAIRSNYFNHQGTAVSVGPAAQQIVVAHNTFSTTADPRFPDDVPTRLDNILVDESGEATMVADGLRGAMAGVNDPQVVPNATWTELSWQFAEYDKGGFWSDERSEAFVVPAHRGVRFVRLTANVTWEQNGRAAREVQFLKNGEPFLGGGPASQYGDTDNAPVTEPTGQNVQSAVIAVEEGDAFTVRARQSSGSTLQVEPGPGTSFSIEAVDG